MAQRIRETTDHFVQEVKHLSERWWGATQRAAETAGARASVYRKRAQCKLDLAAVRRKMSTRYTELGEELFKVHLAGTAAPLGSERVIGLLGELDALKEREEVLSLELADTFSSPAGGLDESTEEDLHL